MENCNEKIFKRNFLGFRKIVLDSASDGVYEIYMKGYNEVANTCVRNIIKNIDELHNQISSDSILSKRNNFYY